MLAMMNERNLQVQRQCISDYTLPGEALGLSKVIVTRDGRSSTQGFASVQTFPEKNGFMWEGGALPNYFFSQYP